MEENEVFTWDAPMKHSPTQIANEEVIGLDNILITPYGNSSEIHDNDQMAAENLVYLSQEPVSYMESAELAVDPNVECVTEEVITDDWGLPGGMERVEVPLEHLTAPDSEAKEVNDMDIPVPTDQDEYTAMRPWPCDFCSRRFRKKAALMNHMVAHQNDRPHSCNLCGVSYVRKCDLMNHLKVHAFVPDGPDGIGFEEMLDRSVVTKPKKKRGRRKKIPVPRPEPEPEEEDDTWENMTSARTQQWSRRARTPPPRPPSPPSVPSPSPPPSPPPVPTDPSRPFVCKHCGVGFAREKALQSHSRIHGGESPLECGECGELCWSREALCAHARHRHPHLPPPRAAPHDRDFSDTDSDNDMDYQVSPRRNSSERTLGADVRGPELFCQQCGVAFQRADLLRRHVAAAHSYKRHDSDTWAEHTCDVCGERCPDALQLLAHAELHADRQPAPRLKKSTRSRVETTLASGLKQFPCKECGKVFGSRSSQQIHVRIHTGERPYACRFCWKAFADGGTLRKHERIHTGEKPYACAVCPRAFNQRVVLREHVRSHHSLPERRANGNMSFVCAVCARAQPSSAELVQHLIQHCDANTALKRRPPSGPRKYKRRRKVKPSPRSWDSPSPRARTPSPVRSPSPAPCAATPRRRRKRTVPPPPPRPKMIHTEPKGKVVKQQPLRSRRPPRHPADDLRAIQPHYRSPSPPLPESPPPTTSVKSEPERLASPYKCEMCSEQFARRDDLLLHVPIHI